jgi:predicted metal-dependent phosphoesterase TrpH
MGCQTPFTLFVNQEILVEKARARNPSKYTHKDHPEKAAGPLHAEQAARLGWKAADLHVHTYFSRDVLPASSNDPCMMYEEAKKKGLGFVSFTDHNTVAAYDRVGWEREGLVPGVEMDLLDEKEVGHTIHINVYMFSKLQFREMEEIAWKQRSLGNFLNYLNENDLPHTYNHPFWFEHGEQPNPSAVYEIAELFPVLEYNRGRTKPLNQLTLLLAEEKQKGIVACSDAHNGKSMGVGRTYAPGENFRQFFENIKTGNACLLPQDMNVHRLVEEANEWIRQVFNLELVQGTCDNVSVKLNKKHLDRLLRFLTRPGFSGTSLLARVFQCLLYFVSNSGIFQSMYLRSQEAMTRDIMQQLRLSSKQLDPALFLP